MPETISTPIARPQAVVAAEATLRERLDAVTDEVVSASIAKLTAELDEIESRAAEREARSVEALAPPPLRPLSEWMATASSTPDGEEPSNDTTDENAKREKQRALALEELELAKQDRIAAEAKRREIEQYAKANDEHMRVAEERLGAELASLKKALSDAKKSAGMRDED
jgi:hypothetical protein